MGCGAIVGFDWSPRDESGSEASLGDGVADGAPVLCAAARDCPGKDSDCAERGCAAGVCVVFFSEAGQLCGFWGVCDGEGSCVECVVADDCIEGSCVDHACASCTNQIEDGAETDIDCGGPDCPGCQKHESCLVDDDCKSGVCTEGNCRG